ncbi:MAG: hypothetical protein GY804_09825 [Alphaproteobacteria bacterium]|nr:hypothetical protein [Alphaproteobacteria bacterium]
MSLVSLADYKTALDISGSGEDTKLTQYSAEVDKKVKNYLGRDIEEAVYTNELYNGNGTHFLVTRQHPITVITKLEVYEGIDSGGSEDWEEWTQNDEYGRLLIEERAVSLYMDTVFPAGSNNIRIKYTAGYAAEDIPDDIDYVCKQLMNMKYLKFDQKLLGKTGESKGVGATSSDTYELDEKKVLEQIEHHKAMRL